MVWNNQPPSADSSSMTQRGFSSMGVAVLTPFGFHRKGLKSSCTYILYSGPTEPRNSLLESTLSNERSCSCLWNMWCRLLKETVTCPSLHVKLWCRYTPPEEVFLDMLYLCLGLKWNRLTVLMNHRTAVIKKFTWSVNSTRLRPQKVRCAALSPRTHCSPCSSSHFVLRRSCSSSRSSSSSPHGPLSSLTLLMLSQFSPSWPS